MNRHWGELSWEMQKVWQNCATLGCPVLPRLLLRSRFLGCVAFSGSAWLIQSFPSSGLSPGLLILGFLAESGWDKVAR